MDDVAKQFAQDLAAALGAAVARDQQVAACRDKARAAGYEMHVALEAVIGFAGSTRSRSAESAAEEPAAEAEGNGQPLKITADDRRFLRSLRIAGGEAR